MSDETPYCLVLANRLLLHAGALSERFAGEAARGVDRLRGRDAALAIVELARSIALLTEAAIELAEGTSTSGTNAAPGSGGGRAKVRGSTSALR